MWLSNGRVSHCHCQLTIVFSLFQPLCRICDRGMTSNAIKVFTGDPSHRVSHLTLLTDSMWILIQYSSQIKVCVIAISSADLQNPNAELRSHLEIFKNDNSLKPKSVSLCSFEMMFSVIIGSFSECRSLPSIFYHPVDQTRRNHADGPKWIFIWHGYGSHSRWRLRGLHQASLC